MPLFLILAFIIAFFAIIFALQNPGYIAINFFVWKFQQSLALVLLLTLAFGVLVGLFVLIPAVIKRSWKIMNQKKRLENLEETFEEKVKEISNQTQKTEEIQYNTQELLEALELTDPKTNLLNRQSVPQLLSYLLQQMKSQKNHSRYSFICVSLINVDYLDAVNDSYYSVETQLLRAVAEKLRIYARHSSWLHYYREKQFVCITPGLNSPAALEYGEYLTAVLAERPIQMTDGSTIPITISIGNAIAQAADQIDSQTLLHQAELELDQKRQARSRFRLF